MKGLRPEERLIVALDVDSVDQAAALVKKLVPLGVTHFKIGMFLYTLAGPAAVEAVHKNGGKVFLDLKFHDIPNTVANALRASVRLGVWMVNVHIQGGSAMMRTALAAAREEAKASGKKAPLLIGVTVLTSMSEKDMVDLGLRKTLKDQVLYLAKLAKEAGLDGIVASAQEAKVVRWASGDDFLIVTPGIRPAPKEDNLLAAAAGQRKDDQQRTAGPLDAIRAGADYLVVGRPILEAQDPSTVACAILEDCARA